MEKAQKVMSEARQSFEEYTNKELSNSCQPCNTDFPVDNTITRLFKNMLRKNNGYGREGFIEWDKHFFKVELDTSGIKEDLIDEAAIELSNNSQNFFEDGNVFTSQIRDFRMSSNNELISFIIAKEKLNFLRDSLLKEK